MRKIFNTVISFLLVIVLLTGLVPCVYSVGDNPFTDVPETAWYKDAALWAYSNQYITGISQNEFGPNVSCSRAQLVTILWAIAGRPEVQIENPFKDVSASAWYYKAVLWAYDTGITAGTSADHFSPKKVCSRATAICLIWNYFGTPSVDGTLWFSDVPTNKYYYNAVLWAVYNGITAGVSSSSFGPSIPVSRAMVVTFIYSTRHLLDGGEHDFVTTNEFSATCTMPAGKSYACSVCGVKRTLYDGSALGHDYAKAELVSDATTTKATVYRLVCTRCGTKDENRSLGKPIFSEPNIPSSLPTHIWNASEKANGINLTAQNGATINITRRWFANAWCYIAHITLNEGQYSAFTGTNIYNQFGNTTSFVRAYDEMVDCLPEAVLLINGDDRILNKESTLRGGVKYGANSPGGATYWNPSNGSFGTVSDLKTYSFDSLKSLGVTDTYYFGSSAVKNGRMNMSEFNSKPDYEEASYSRLNYRRARSIIGFRRDGTTTHVYLVVADGGAFTDVPVANPANGGNDRASYGNIQREMMILMSTLDVDYAAALDGGWSSTMIIRLNGNVEQLNAGNFDLHPWGHYEGRQLWDFLYVK